jgi:hypothetical protein
LKKRLATTPPSRARACLTPRLDVFGSRRFRKRFFEPPGASPGASPGALATPGNHDHRRERLSSARCFTLRHERPYVVRLSR